MTEQLNQFSQVQPEQVVAKIERAMDDPLKALHLLLDEADTFNRCHSVRDDQQNFWKQITHVLEKDNKLPILKVAADQHGIDLSNSPVTSEWSSCDAPKQGEAKQAAVKPAATEQPGLVRDLNHFSVLAKPLFDQLLGKYDHDHTGTVTKHQMAEAVQDHSFTGEQAKTLAAMYLDFDQLQNLSGQHGSLPEPGITSADLTKFKETQPSQQEQIISSAKLESWANNRFSLYHGLGRDGSKALTQQQITEELQDPKISDQEKGELTYLKNHFSEIASGKESVSIEQIQDNFFVGRSPEGILTRDLTIFFGRNPGGSNDFNQDLYVNNDPKLAIQPRAVNQGYTGDCNFEGPLAAIAASNPELIKNAIKDNHNGTYSVTFPGINDYPITVNAPTDTEMYLYNHGNWTGTWASVMEKAYGRLQQQIAENSYGLAEDKRKSSGTDDPPLPPPTKDFYTQQETAGSKGVPHSASYSLYLLTGNKSLIIPVDESHQQAIQDQLRTAFTPAGSPIKGVVTVAPTGDTDEPYHAYAIVGLLPDAGDGPTLLVMNPQQTDINAEKLKQVPWKTFLGTFNDIYFDH